MVTIKTLRSYEKLHNIVEDFLRKKVTEYRNAEYGEPVNSTYGRPAPIFKEFEIVDREQYINGSLKKVGENIIISFGYNYDLDIESHTLPLEILFDDDFYVKIKSMFDEKRQRAKEIEERETEKKLYEKLKAKYEGEK